MRTTYSIATAILLGGLAALCLTPWMSPQLALAAGAAVRLVLPGPLPKQTHALAKWLLQISIVLLGFGLNLPTVLKAGTGGVLLAAVSIGVTLTLGYFIGPWLGVRRGTGRLISAGTAICGGSAIAAVGSATDAEEGDMTVAMGTVFVLNAVALYLFPLIGHAMHLSQHQFGVWAGVAIQDISSTVGAAAHYGPEALTTATAVKLSRALWIVPVVIGFVISARLKRKWKIANGDFGFTTTTAATGKIQVPWFIGLFVLASLLRTCLPAIGTAAPTIGRIAAIGLTLTLLLVGTGLNRKLLASVGWRAMTLGMMLWVVLAVGGLFAVLNFA